MKKNEFLTKLDSELKKRNVRDAADITAEYEQHFAFKLADGYSEEEIAAKLGDPVLLAAQFDALPEGRAGGRGVLAIAGLGVVDVAFGLFSILLFAFGVVMAGFSLACGLVAVGLLTGVRAWIFAWIPTLPYGCAAVLGISAAALAVLSAAGTVWFFGFWKRLLRAFGRFHRNVYVAVRGQAILPSLSLTPQFSPRGRRTLKTLARVSLLVFAAGFVLGYLLCVCSAGSFEFWHTWGWFGYGG